jgi:hypothetical protein
MQQSGATNAPPPPLAVPTSSTSGADSELEQDIDEEELVRERNVRAEQV